MNEQDIIKGILMNYNITLTFVEVCHHCHLSEEELMNWIAHGLLGDEVRSSVEAAKFNHDMIVRIHTAYRLHNELEVNVQGTILALELLDQIAEMRNELAILKRY